MLVTFWICAFLVIYVYLGYPALIASGLLGKRKKTKEKDIQPQLSVLIPAHNEERVIGAKLRNMLSQNYSLARLEILVGDDGSSDRTARIVKSMEAGGVALVRNQEPRGKSDIQNKLVERSHGDLLVFTDADCFLPANALETLVRHFADPLVGLVANCASISNRNETAAVEGESLYWRYERWLRGQESDRGLLAMASGSLFVMRRGLWSPLDPNVGDDFVLPLLVARAGFRNVLETQISAETELSQNQPHSLFRMKTRIISKDLRGLLRNAACLNPLKVGAVAMGLLSHKLLRWAVPYFLIGLYVSNVFLTAHTFYAITLAAQTAFYALSVFGLLLGGSRVRFPLSVAVSFCVVNFAALFGTLHCLTLQSAGRWKPVR